MKIIFILSVAVIFWENLAITNANLKMKNVGEHFQAKRQIYDGIREHETSQMYLNAIQVGLRSSLKLMKNKIVRSMNKAARIKTAEIKKLAISSKQKIKSVVRQQRYDFSEFAKLSLGELGELKDKITKARTITSENAKKFLDLINVSVDELKKILETTGENVKELTENNTAKLTIYNEQCKIKIQDFLDKKEMDKASSTAKDATVELNKISTSSNEDISKMYETSKANVENVESTRSKEVEVLRDSTKKQYDGILPPAGGLKDYVTNMHGKINKLAKDLSHKFKDMLDNCLGLIGDMVAKHKDSIINLGKTYGKLLTAIATKNEPNITKYTRVMKEISYSFMKSNKYIYEQFLKELSEQSELIWDEVTQKIAEIKTCSPNKPCE